jgi:hypothetical protein
MAEELGGLPELLLGPLVLLPFLLALPWAPWNCLKLAEEKPKGYIRPSRAL